MMPQYRKLTTLCYAAVLAFGLAACGGGGTETAEAPLAPDPGPDPALGLAQMAAAVAATAADTAADAAEGAVMAQDANAAADAASYAVANNAAMRARAAATAAQGASDAAAATDDTAAAEAQQAIAEAKQGEAETEQGNAEMYADMVAVAHQANLDEIQRVMDVTDARIAAMGSYMAADADATKAEMQAAEAETTAPGSPGAVTAGEAATAARTAANAAMAAHGAIMDDMTKTQADAQAAEAATQAGLANDGYLTAMAENDDIQTTGSQIAENNRQNAVTAARKYGGAAADNAMQSATDARAAANAAKSAHDDAMAEYTRAKSARTNSVKAKEYADAAGVAYAAANSAAGSAHAAYMAAKAAVDGVMDDSSLEDANTARDTAETQEGIAMGHMSTAMTQRTAAEGAGTKATMYADMHVLGLFKMANADYIVTAADPDANVDKTETDLIAKNRAAHVAAVDTAIAATANAQVAFAQNTATAVWPSLSGPVEGADGELGTDDDLEHGSGLITVTATVGGEALVMVRASAGDDEETGTDDDIMANFSEEDDDLGSFAMFQLSNGDSGRDGTSEFQSGVRAIVFTNKEQANERMEARTVTVNNVDVTSAARIGKGAGPVGPGEPGTTPETRHDFSGTYDHDGMRLTGTFDCVDPNLCSHTRIEDNTDTNDVNEEEVISISGYKFTGTGTTDAVPSVDDMNYITFGFWLDEDAPADDQRLHEYVFGAFRGGGTQLTSAETLIGKATYTGSAGGVRSRAATETSKGRVDFFSGTATLNADFGANNAGGKITGRIHSIVAGGYSVSDPIYLSLSDLDAAADNATNIDDDGTFDGRAWMGTGTVGEDGEYDRLRTGVWAGAFYSNKVGDDVIRNGSAAGTFGVTDNPDEATEDRDTYVGAFGAHCGSSCGSTSTN